jgi:hypothetical protein
VPLFGENEKPYRPEKQEMLEAQDVFTSKKPKDIRRVESTINYEKAPIYDLPEVLISQFDALMILLFGAGFSINYFFLLFFRLLSWDGVMWESLR